MSQKRSKKAQQQRTLLERAALHIRGWTYHLYWKLIGRNEYRWIVLRERMRLIWRMGPVDYLRVWRAFRTEYARLQDEHGRERVKCGRLDAFAETGTEGYCWEVYEDGKSGYDGLVSLEKDDHLKIFRHDGAVAFDGIVDPDPKAGYRPFPLNPAYGQPCAFGCWIHWTQRGWDVEEWAALFFHGVIISDKHELLREGTDAVPLRAIVIKSEKSLKEDPEEDDEDSE